MSLSKNEIDFELDILDTLPKFQSIRNETVSFSPVNEAIIGLIAHSNTLETLNPTDLLNARTFRTAAPHVHSKHAPKCSLQFIST